MDHLAYPCTLPSYKDATQRPPVLASSSSPSPLKLKAVCSHNILYYGVELLGLQQETKPIVSNSIRLIASISTLKITSRDERDGHLRNTPFGFVGNKMSPLQLNNISKILSQEKSLLQMDKLC